MWYVSRVGAWLKQRPHSVVFWPVLVSVLASAAAMAICLWVIARWHPSWAGSGPVFTIVVAALVGGALAYVATRIYLELLRHLMDQAEQRIFLSEKLGEEQLLLRSLMEHTPDHIYFKDPASRFIRINTCMAKLFGLDDPAEAVGKTDRDFFADEHARQALADEREIMRTGLPMIGKVERETWPDGRVTWASSTKLPLRDRRGAIIGTFGISRDVTEQVLRDLEVRQLSLAVEQSPDVVLVTDVEGRITYVNPRFTEVTGYSAAEAVGHNPRLLKSDRTPPSVHADLWATIKAGRIWAGELVNRRKNGESYWSRLLVAPLRDQERAITHFVAVSEDVTPRKEAEAMRQAMIDGLRSVLESADDLVACANLDDLYRRAVEVARDRLGLERVGLAVVRGTDVWSTYGTNLRGETTDERSLHYPKPPDWGNRLRSRTGQDRRWVSGDATLYDWDGEQMRAVGRGPVVTTLIQTDERLIGVLYNDCARSGGIPDPIRQEVVAVFCSLLGNLIARKEAELDRRRAEASQREWMERTDRLNALGIMAAGMAHEINNPLQGMLSHLHAAAAELPPDGPAGESLGMVAKGIDQISGLIRKLLVMGSANEAGTELAECQDCVRFVVQLLKSQLEKDRVQIRVEGTDTPLWVKLSRREVCQVLINLFLNARDALPHGGEVVVSMGRDGDALALIRIRDGGLGMTPDVMTRIFTPFFTTKGGRGTGLGLAVADSLLRGCGGRIDVKSEPERGSEFTLRIPLLGEMP
jgi:PAS domain S-box-containing protein